ncbi:AEC family transporter [Pseudodesulfovibrio sp. zrk46]|uniref:AEC family transporter n=1 Tax=Pseudodesulfovibrio sp. zrk46 TaxID=2725288 RepID=UPI00144A2A7B|nr:AEC family transporter [Pseudodesulfovibrio sp. zrk46]QJB56030.1 AEC family transporter [Pseudodesulfovibrio sp. zrk46]
MENLLLLILCFSLGLIFKLSGLIEEKASDALNVLIIYLALPALALLYTHSLPLGPELFLPASMGWIVFFLGYWFFTFIGKLLGLDRKTVVCLTLVGGLGNTSFVGLPLIEVAFGPDYIGIGMLCDQAGSFLALSVPGVILAAKTSGQNIATKDLVKRILMFPPLIALILGFTLQPFPFPDWMQGLLARLGSMLTPLAMISVGLTLRLGEVTRDIKEVCLGLGFKLLLAPIAIYILFMGILGLDDIVTRVTIFEAAMGPMVTAGIIAIRYELRPRLAASLMGIGTPLSFVTLWGWYQFIQ